jgi:hypothetical protein
MLLKNSSHRLTNHLICVLSVDLSKSPRDITDLIVHSVRAAFPERFGFGILRR